STPAHYCEFPLAFSPPPSPLDESEEVGAAGDDEDDGLKRLGRPKRLFGRHRYLRLRPVSLSIKDLNLRLRHLPKSRVLQLKPPQADAEEPAVRATCAACAGRRPRPSWPPRVSAWPARSPASACSWTAPTASGTCTGTSCAVSSSTCCSITGRRPSATLRRCSDGQPPSRLPEPSLPRLSSPDYRLDGHRIRDAFHSATDNSAQPDKKPPVGSNSPDLNRTGPTDAAPADAAAFSGARPPSPASRGPFISPAGCRSSRGQRECSSPWHSFRCRLPRLRRPRPADRPSVERRLRWARRRGADRGAAPPEMPDGRPAMKGGRSVSVELRGETPVSAGARRGAAAGSPEAAAGGEMRLRIWEKTRQQRVPRDGAAGARDVSLQTRSRRAKKKFGNREKLKALGAGLYCRGAVRTFMTCDGKKMPKKSASIFLSRRLCMNLELSQIFASGQSSEYSFWGPAELQQQGDLGIYSGFEIHDFICNCMTYPTSGFIAFMAPALTQMLHFLPAFTPPHQPIADRSAPDLPDPMRLKVHPEWPPGPWRRQRAQAELLPELNSLRSKFPLLTGRHHAQCPASAVSAVQPAHLALTEQYEVRHRPGRQPLRPSGFSLCTSISSSASSGSFLASSAAATEYRRRLLSPPVSSRSPTPDSDSRPEASASSVRTFASSAWVVASSDRALASAASAASARRRSLRVAVVAAADWDSPSGFSGHFDDGVGGDCGGPAELGAAAAFSDHPAASARSSRWQISASCSAEVSRSPGGEASGATAWPASQVASCSRSCSASRPRSSASAAAAWQSSRRPARRDSAPASFSCRRMFASRSSRSRPAPSRFSPVSSSMARSLSADAAAASARLARSRSASARRSLASSCSRESAWRRPAASSRAASRLSDTFVRASRAAESSSLWRACSSRSSSSRRAASASWRRRSSSAWPRCRSAASCARRRRRGGGGQRLLQLLDPRLLPAGRQKDNPCGRVPEPTASGRITRAEEFQNQLQASHLAACVFSFSRFRLSLSSCSTALWGAAACSAAATAAMATMRVHWVECAKLLLNLRLRLQPSESLRVNNSVCPLFYPIIAAMPCGSFAAQEPRLLVASTSSGAAASLGAGDSPQPQPALSRFHVAHACRDAAASELAAAAAHHEDVVMEDPRCEEFHESVGILDSLPWCRNADQREPSLDRANSAAAFQTILEMAEDEREAGYANTNREIGDTLTAQAAKAVSQMRISASSANLTSHRKDAAGRRDTRGRCRRSAAAEEAADAGSHLEPPWSHNSCCPGSAQRPASPVSLHQLAAFHRSERLGASVISRSSSVRRRPSSTAQHHHHHHHHHHHQPHHQHQNQQHHCASEDCCAPPTESRGGHADYQEYLDQLNERVQLWMLEAADGSHGIAAGDCQSGPDCASCSLGLRQLAAVPLQLLAQPSDSASWLRYRSSSSLSRPILPSSKLTRRAKIRQRISSGRCSFSVDWLAAVSWMLASSDTAWSCSSRSWYTVAKQACSSSSSIHAPGRFGCNGGDGTVGQSVHRRLQQRPLAAVQQVNHLVLSQQRQQVSSSGLFNHLGRVDGGQQLHELAEALTRQLDRLLLLLALAKAAEQHGAEHWRCLGEQAAVQVQLPALHQQPDVADFVRREGIRTAAVLHQQVAPLRGPGVESLHETAQQEAAVRVGHLRCRLGQVRLHVGEAAAFSALANQCPDCGGGPGRSRRLALGRRVGAQVAADRIALQLGHFERHLERVSLGELHDGEQSMMGVLRSPRVEDVFYFCIPHRSWTMGDFPFMDNGN
uniref:HCO3_cotransp domain-containing protein n=1 Tax=Macrostomum lignano TaxID=282301 RepID=A0A1I8IFY5_9PLAT